MSEPDFNEEDVRKTYRLLEHKEQTELRFVHPQKKLPPKSEFVDNEEDFVKQCKLHNGKYNCYYGLNERNKNGTKSEDVVSVGLIPVDVDPVRTHGVQDDASTEQEQLEAFGTVYSTILNWCLKQGFTLSGQAMSGNGFQVLFKIPRIPITDENRLEVQAKLQKFQELLQEHSTAKVHVDKVGDLARIFKVIGTISIKGNPTSERPHRLANWIVYRPFEDNKLKDFILSLQSQKIGAIESLEKARALQGSENIVKKPKTDTNEILKDKGIASLYFASVKKELRSELEMKLVVAFIRKGLSREQIFELMPKRPDSKWLEASEAYRNKTYTKAMEWLNKTQPIPANLGEPTNTEQNKEEGNTIVPDQFFKPDLLDSIHSELSKDHKLDTNEKMTAFTISITAYLQEKERKSFALLGDSSVGKDSILDTLLKHLPDFMKLTRGTGAFLEDELSSKRGVFFSEVNKHREGGANSEITETLKQLTEGGLQIGKKDVRTGYKTARQDNTKQMTVGYATTEEQRDPELDTRFICIPVKAPASKIAVVNQDTLTKAAAFIDKSAPFKSWIWKGLSTLEFKDETPIIPYASKLVDCFDNSNPRSMRDVKRLMALTKAIAWLHQKQRYNYVGRVIAEPCDFINAFMLAGGFFNLSYSELDLRLKDILDYMDTKIGKVARHDIQQALDIKSVNTIKKRMGVLEDRGYVELVEQDVKATYYLRCQATYQDLSKGINFDKLVKMFEEYKLKTYLPTMIPPDTLLIPPCHPVSHYFLHSIDDKGVPVKADLSKGVKDTDTVPPIKFDGSKLDRSIPDLVRDLKNKEGIADEQKVAEAFGEGFDKALLNSLAVGEVYQPRAGFLAVLD